jgi:hypothetical protein
MAGGRGYDLGHERRQAAAASRVTLPPFLLRAVVCWTAFVLVMVLHRALPVADTAVWGDPAADMLLTERAAQGALLTGHYSRFGFNHPGPFFLYVRHLGDRAAGRFLDHQAQVTALALVSAMFLALAMAAAAPREQRGAGPWMASAVALAVILVQHGRPGLDVLGPWMPAVLVAPFLAYTLLLSHVGRGRLSLLPVTTFCGAALAHGYAPILPMVALSWPLALVIGLRAHRRQGQPRAAIRIPVLVSAGVVAIFALPIVMDLVVHLPGNAAVILTRGTYQLRPARFVEALRVASIPWRAVSAVVWIAAIAGVVLCWRDDASRGAVRHMAAWVGFFTVGVVLFLLGVPGEPYPFLVSFSLGGVLALVLTAIGAGTVELHRRAGRITGAVVLATAAAAALTTTHGPTGRHVPAGRVLGASVTDDMAAHGVRQAQIAFRRHDHWPIAAGVLLDLRRRHVPACVIAAHLDFLFTPERVCALDRAPRVYEIVAIDECAARCVARSDRWGLTVVTPQAPAGPAVTPGSSS